MGIANKLPANSKKTFKENSMFTKLFATMKPRIIYLLLKNPMKFTRASIIKNLKRVIKNILLLKIAKINKKTHIKICLNNLYLLSYL